jgi:hypothetical protein
MSDRVRIKKIESIPDPFILGSDSGSDSDRVSLTRRVGSKIDTLSYCLTGPDSILLDWMIGLKISDGCRGVNAAR